MLSVSSLSNSDKRPKTFLSKAGIDTLRARSALLSKVRNYFTNNGLMEVETPLLSHYPSIDLHIDPFITNFVPSGKTVEGCTTPLYLQTSPEFAMKRLLASGSGSIFQICKSFRNGEIGSNHNPEFTIIEWYNIGFSLEDMIRDVENFIEYVTGINNVTRTPYSEAFEKHVGVNPHKADVYSLEKAAKSLKLLPPLTLKDDKNDWLSYLLVELVEPNLGFETPQIIYDYPSSQAGLAKIRKGPPDVAERFELFINGIELCNGYHELLDHREQELRFQNENYSRKKHGKPELPIDNNFLGALEFGLPKCSGVSVGFDRLFMAANGFDNIKETLSFPYSIA